MMKCQLKEKVHMCDVLLKDTNLASSYKLSWMSWKAKLEFSFGKAFEEEMSSSKMRIVRPNRS